MQKSHTTSNKIITPRAISKQVGMKQKLLLDNLNDESIGKKSQGEEISLENINMVGEDDQIIAANSDGRDRRDE